MVVTPDRILRGGGGGTPPPATPYPPGYYTDSQGNTVYVDAAGNQTRVGGGGGGGGSRSAAQGPDPQAQANWQAQFNQQQAESARAQMESDRQFAWQQQQHRDQLVFDIQSREQRIREYSADLTERQRQFDVSTGLERERLAQEIRVLEMRLSFDREQLAENRRQYDLTFGEGQRQFGLTFGEGQRQFDIGAGQNYLGKAVDIAGRDTLRSAAYLLGDTGGMTPIEGALRAFRPVSVTGAGGMSPEAAVKNVAAGPPRQPVPAVPPDSATATYIDPVTGKRTNVRPRAKGTRGAGKGYLVGEGEGGEGLRAGTAEVVQMTPDRRVKAIIPIERAYALGTGDAYEPIPTVPRPPPIQHPIQYPGYPTVPTPGPGYNGGPWPIPAWREAWKEAYNRLPQTMGGGINPVTGLPISTYQKKGTPLVPGTEEEYLRASYERVPEAPYGGPANFNQDQTYWEDILARSEERLKADPNDAAATVARTEAFQKLGEMSTRNLLYRAFYGNVPPAAGSLTQGPVSLAPNAQGEIASAERSGISPLFDTPLASSESQAARFYRLPPDVQQTILSAYGLRNLNAGESLRRMKEVTPVGLRAGSGQFGYG